MRTFHTYNIIDSYHNVLTKKLFHYGDQLSGKSKSSEKRIKHSLDLYMVEFIRFCYQRIFHWI